MIKEKKKDMAEKHDMYLCDGFAASGNKLARTGRGKAFKKKKRNNDELLLDIELGRIAAKRDRTFKKGV